MKNEAEYKNDELYRTQGAEFTRSTSPRAEDERSQHLGHEVTRGRHCGIKVEMQSLHGIWNTEKTNKFNITSHEKCHQGM
ncbi:hypothetical protein M8J77_012226 [Diaphorina citri]|nr:hypothetical protein M8J77_012226 [Diaphorina citri]